MGLTGHGIVFGLGYLTGRPAGRRQLLRWRDQALELTRRPEVKRLRDRGWNLAQAQAQASAATRGLSTKLRGKTASPVNATGSDGDSATADSTTVDSASAAADLHAALAGTHSPTNPGISAPGFGGTTVAEDSRAIVPGLDRAHPATSTPLAPTERP